MTPDQVRRGPSPIIVSALFGPEDHAWLDRQRRTHFPVERNRLPAHLTLFHHLPPSVESELKQRLRAATSGVAPRATIAGLISLGRGVAYRIESPALAEIRADLADAFAPLLTPQDKAGWRAHVTVQNKVEALAAKRLLAELSAAFRPRSLAISGLAAWWYRDGPWEQMCAYRFR